MNINRMLELLSTDSSPLSLPDCKENSMPKKFLKVPKDKDTRILFESEMKLHEFDVLYQKWFWDGITAESIIFSSDEITHLDDNDILAKVRCSDIVNQESQLTIKHSESGFTFINFNFESD